MQVRKNRTQEQEHPASGLVAHSRALIGRVLA